MMYFATIKDTMHKLFDFLSINNPNIKSLIINNAIKDNLIYLKKNEIIPAHSTNKNVERDRYKKYWTQRIQEHFNKLFPDDILIKFNYL